MNHRNSGLARGTSGSPQLTLENSEAAAKAKENEKKVVEDILINELENIWITNNKKIIVIQLDYLHGPIWTSDAETGELLTGVDIVDRDKIVKELNYKIQTMYSSYYEFDSHDCPYRFNFDREKSEKNEMLALIEKLIHRLNEICDGSYVVEDRETSRIKAL